MTVTTDEILTLAKEVLIPLAVPLGALAFRKVTGLMLALLKYLEAFFTAMFRVSGTAVLGYYAALGAYHFLR